MISNSIEEEIMEHQNTTTTDLIEQESNQLSCITLLGMHGDITITWSAENDAKIKDLVRKKMAEGYSFFTTRKVVIEAIKVKRKLGPKGVDTIKDLIIDDETFDKMIKDMDDRDVATLVRDGDAQLAKRRGNVANAIERARTPEDVIKSKQAMAVRPLVGG
jgi:hypothetical protein